MISSLLSLIYANLRASWRKYILTGLGIAVAAERENAGRKTA